MDHIYQAIIVGGGAAGFFAAIHAANKNPDSSFILLEATSRPLKKVKISGGGRCNVTHSCFDPRELVKNYPRGFRELLGPFMRFGPRDTIDFFENLGVKLKTENDGRMFPTTDDSSTIIDALEKELARCGCSLRRNALVSDVQLVRKESDNFYEVALRDDSILRARKVLMATGSTPAGYQFASALGHSIVETVPSLFTFNCDDSRLQDLAGVSFPKASLTLTVGGKEFRFSGPLLITHWGLSGPAVLKLSAFAARELFKNNYQGELKVNFLGDMVAQSTLEALTEFKQKNGAKSITSPPNLPITRNFWQSLVARLEILSPKNWADLDKNVLNEITAQLTQAKFLVQGKGAFKEEFVTAGGISLKEVDFKTMESKVIPGLYFAGEILDIDGITGGFNFQNAWTTGFLAGCSLGPT